MDDPKLLLYVNNKSIGEPTVHVQIHPKLVGEALAAARTDDVDNVFFQVDNDVIAVSSKDLDLRGVVPGQTITFRDSRDNSTIVEGKILYVDDQNGSKLRDSDLLEGTFYGTIAGLSIRSLSGNKVAGIIVGLAIMGTITVSESAKSDDQNIHKLEAFKK